jgi:folylpolyglutamate synthase/dihydropteroate synthase
VNEGLEGTVFSCEIRGSRYDNIRISMPGRHQVDNAVCALTTFDVLRHMKDGGNAARQATQAQRLDIEKPAGSASPLCAGAGADVAARLLPLRSSSDALRAGMKAARLPGRFQIVTGALMGGSDVATPGDSRRLSACLAASDRARQNSADPLVILDGAHNPAGAAALRLAVDSLLQGRKILVLIAMMRDKQADDILKEIHTFADGVIFTETSNDRGMDAASLADAWSRIGADVATESIIRRPREAYDDAVSKVRSRQYDALVVCGSLYLISDILSATLWVRIPSGDPQRR